MIQVDNYRDIASELRRRIRKGVYKNDTALPTRMELLKEFNVARSTLDRAVSLLIASGDVVNGARTVVEAVAHSKIVAETMHQYILEEYGPNA